MSLRSLTFSTLILLIALCQTLVGQTRTPKLVDEFAANLCSDDFRGRIDSFLAAISNDSPATGRIVITPDKTMPGRSIKYEKMISAHIAFRGFNPNGIVISRNPIGDSGIQFWLVPDGTKAIGSEARNSLGISKTTLFDASWIASVKGGEVEFGESWGIEPCDFGLFIDQFASALQSDAALNAHLVAASDKRMGPKTIERALRLTAETLTGQYGIAADRIKTSYAGKRKDSEMQLWLVPLNGTTPRFREDATEW